MARPPGLSPAFVGTAPGFWAVTTFYNPAGFRLKLANYRIFRQHLPLPLLAIELSSGGPFELESGDADILVQIRGGDVLWQEERLINRALPALPADCTRVAWVDCDVVFEDPGWVEAAGRLLDTAALVQPFSHLWQMPRGWSPGGAMPPPLSVWMSIPRLLADGSTIEECLGPTKPPLDGAHGIAWAASRHFVERHGLYDACIVGGGDPRSAPPPLERWTGP